MAIRDSSTGQFNGVNADLGRELAQRLGVPQELIAVGSNVAAVDEVKNGRADVTFLVALPELAAQIDFSLPSIQYETTLFTQTLPFKASLTSSARAFGCSHPSRAQLRRR